MIYYDPGHWGLTGMVRCTGSVFPKAMIWATPCTLVAGVLHYMFHQNTDLIDELGIGDVAATVFGGFNFILGFLMVFRSQQAYSRWWEGGTLLQQVRGEWFNAFSCLVAFSNAASEKTKEVQNFQQQLVRLFSLLYGCALTQVSSMPSNDFELINLDGFDGQSLNFLETCHDKCEVTLQWIQRLIVEAEQKSIVKIAPPILSRVYNELGNGIVNLNNARKIRDFPMPFPLAQMIMVMLLVHAVFTPLICAATLKSPAWASLLTFVVIFSFWSVLYISLELEMPFGDDPNDLPLQKMAEDLNLSLRTLVHPLASAVPSFTTPDNLEALHAKTVNFDGDLSVTGRSTHGIWEQWKPAFPHTDSKVKPDALSPSTAKASAEKNATEPVPSPTPLHALPPALEVKVQGGTSESRAPSSPQAREGPPSQPEIHKSAPDRPLVDGASASPSDGQPNRPRAPESAHSPEKSTPQPAPEDFQPPNVPSSDTPLCSVVPTQ